ncbi:MULTISPECIES: hypothetical protein [unclassified Synechocystis]|uniref:hypothetical protein n=1 Tax=unclassified Synechocystis TaxID=2640012 RepID=UPI0003FB2530|nr:MULTISPECIES: hypothetical protein [unclassified Synechocystis]AIE72788.1 Uridine phosphorylase [Synechocystis sp. PCC 6714]MCT0254573.1 hypothetical protein [Synechocystis sp. CS-94]
MPRPFDRSKKRLAVPLWYERILALILLANYGLVLFDLTYIPLRDFWLQGTMQLSIKVGPFQRAFPKQPVRIFPFDITPYYDWVKGIEPYRSTTAYLELVDKLNNKLDEQALDGSGNIQQAEEIDNILDELRQESAQMIVENPFQIANKTGTFERIKNRMRVHVFGSTDASATQSFETFWSKEYLLKNGLTSQLLFFDREIRPLMATNYFREIGENGQPIDNFGLIDFPFFVIFLVDFLGRTRLISLRYRGVSWVDAMLWRWYDFFLFLPFFRWLRIIPLTVRLDKAKLMDLNKVKGQATQGFVAIIAEDMTEVIVVRLVEQMQQLVREGALRKLLDRAKTTQYININNRNELVEIIRIISQVLLQKVLPEVEPEVQDFMLYNMQSSLDQIYGYSQLQNLPGVKNMQREMMANMIAIFYQRTLIILQSFLEKDTEFDRLWENLLTKLTTELNLELNQQHYLEDIEELLIDFLEEFKINYLQKLSEADIELILGNTAS